MAKHRQTVPFSLVNPHAGGIDIGSRSNWACAGAGRGQVREFGVFTEDHHCLAKWLQGHKVTTVAMESTGVYWKPLFLILKAYAFEVLLVNASHIKNVRGKKTDMADCQWIWQLHRAGLLRGSFQPDGPTEELRTYNRQRQSLVEGAARQVSKMQKALVLMNLQLPVVLTDITGKSGQAIIGAILDGERDGQKLAALADRRVRAGRETIAKALTGQWHVQQLFTLRQSWQLYHYYRGQVLECDKQIERLLGARTGQAGQCGLDYSPSKKKFPYKNAPAFDLGRYAYQLCDGIDLMEVDGISYNLVLTLASEVGFDLEGAFPSAKHFASWMGLSPNRRVTGGKTLSSRTQRNRNRLAKAFRQCANTVGRQKGTALSDFFRRIALKKGRKVAITATARKLAVVTYIMLTKKQGYQPEGVEGYRQKARAKKVRYIQKTMKQLDIRAEELCTF